MRSPVPPLGPTIYSRLPPYYQGLLPDLFDEEYPAERFATCETCVSCQSVKSPYLSTKCCTYQPSLPNYLAGGVLADAQSARGRERLQRWIASGAGVTPYGVVRSAAQAAVREATLPPGRIPTRAEAEALRCQFFDAGACTIWSHREHLCSTFFCYSVGGRAGRAFWKILNDYLMLVERELSLYALIQLGWRPEQLNLADPLADWKPVNNTVDAQQRLRLWREWVGREAELYVECHRVVASMSQATTRAVLGWKGEHLERRLEAALTRFRLDDAPELVVLVQPVRLEQVDDTHVLVHGAGGQSVRVPRLVALFLNQFDGVRTTSAVVRLAASLDLDVANHIPSLLTTGVLRPVSR